METAGGGLVEARDRHGGNIAVEYVVAHRHNDGDRFLWIDETGVNHGKEFPVAQPRTMQNHRYPYQHLEPCAGDAGLWVRWSVGVGKGIALLRKSPVLPASFCAIGIRDDLPGCGVDAKSSTGVFCLRNLVAEEDENTLLGNAEPVKKNLCGLERKIEGQCEGENFVSKVRVSRGANVLWARACLLRGNPGLF